MKSKEYWEKRSAERMVEYLEQSEKTAAEIARTYRQALIYIEAEIKAIFKRLQLDFNLDENTVKVIIKSGDLSALEAAFKEKTEAYSYRINRLLELQKNIEKTCENIAKIELKKSTDLYKNTVFEAYNKTIFDLQKGLDLYFGFSQIPASRIEKILSLNWSGMHYSSRIWSNTSNLAKGIKEEIIVGFLTGKSVYKTANDVAKKFNNSLFNSRRLVRTETNYIANSAELESYKECGISEYVFVATLDLRTSKLCQGLDGKKFKISEAKAGANYPPMHPFCRSTTIADLGDESIKNMERWAKDPRTGKYITVPAAMNYKEWLEKYGNGLTKGKDGGIIKARGGDVSISAIEKPIEQKHTGKGNPNAVRLFDVDLNNRQNKLLEQLAGYDSRVIIPKKSVNMADLSALTAKTGDEFAVFTKSNKRLVIRGDNSKVNIDIQQAKQLAEEGYRWSGHTHPGINLNTNMPSDGDKQILSQFKQETSSVYDSKGRHRTFEKE